MGGVREVANWDLEEGREKELWLVCKMKNKLLNKIKKKNNT